MDNQCIQKLLISIWIWGASFGLLGNAAKSLGRWVPPRHVYICNARRCFQFCEKAGRLCNLNKKERWIVVRLIKFQILWGELNAIRVLAEMEKLEKDTRDCANQDRSRVRGTWRHSCKSIHLRNFWTPKFLTLPIPQNSNLPWCKKRCATPPYCGDTNASDVILMLNKYELYVSWSPFWWKTRWLHRSRACSETWELNGVQKHHLSILPCSNYLIVSLYRQDAADSYCAAHSFGAVVNNCILDV